MTSRFRRTGLATLLNLGFGLSFLASSLLVILFVDSIMRAEARTEAEEKARILQDRNLALHNFYTEELKPGILAWSAPFRSPDYFEPSWMSSSYAVHRIQEYFKDLNPTGYSVKDAAVGARNPDSEADPVEAAFIARTNADPALLAESGQRKIGGQDYLLFLRRGEVLVESCLQCHGDPRAAPAGLLALYGSERGFHREGDLGKVISAISIRVPLSTALASVRRTSLLLSAVLVLCLAAAFLVQHLLARRLLYAPIAALRDKALDISTHKERLGEFVPPPPGRELAELAEAFNGMSAALREGRDHLEERIRERSVELASANASLERDVEERRRTEELLMKALGENRRLLRELQHRAKNSFVMIQGLIGLMGSETDSEEARRLLDRLDLRVRSVSELYTYLYASGSSTELRLDEYCARVVSSLEGLQARIRVESDLEPVKGTVSTAAPLGLILVELLTNAFKHAYPGDGPGLVRVGLRKEGDFLRLEVRDEGRGMARREVSAGSDSEAAGREGGKEGGSGLELLRELAEQIGGSLELQGGAGGTCWVLRFPAAPPRSGDV